MPEYPEVTVVTNSLRESLINQKIIKVKISLAKLIKNIDTKEFERNIINKQIIKVENIGKFIQITLEDETRIISHLRMSGKFYVGSLSDETHLLHQKHNYVFFYLDNQKIVAYNDARQFGGFELVLNNDKRSLYEIKKLAKLPKDVDTLKLHQKLLKKNISIKSVLLDQSLVLGIGNIYADEALYQAKVHPMTKCNLVTISELNKILNAAQEIMDASILAGGSSVHTYQSVNDAKGTFQEQLKVYGKANTLCQRCKNTKLIKVRLDYKPNGRGTTFCPQCQIEKMK
ncbi:bifunctional DNA-formamidopyrimidine glycosylase/DNA-(apurinic or apyrimidinic site) lyase [Mycoplasma hafezii]|uniref:bifunctional DNA-formamidopyrimidine glycosylase/DNA-(apurinic or apyrimidinic site) lyase n=1 Tax=Mycoplasma hafezii TaxID=525886 RepID=UPI003CF1D56C